MEENTFWIRIWKIIAISFIAFIAVIAGCVSHENRLIKSLVDSGVDPVEARCAISPISPRCDVVGAMRATNKANN